MFLLGLLYSYLLLFLIFLLYLKITENEKKDALILQLENQIKEQKIQIENIKHNQEDRDISEILRLKSEKESKEVKTKEEHKKELDKLFSQIEILENKIIPLENMNNLNNDSILSIKSKISQQINIL